MSTKRFLLTATVFVLALLLASPAWAQATGRGGGSGGGGGGAAPPSSVGRGGGAPPQGGGPVHAAPRVTVGVGVGWGYGYGYGPWGPYGAWGYGYGPWGPWGPWGGWGWGWGWGGPWGCCYYDYMFASVRIQMQPKEAKAAEVFVDGYKAGIVEDFDGTFQHLSVWAGDHEITLFLEGYATQNHRLYLGQGTTTKIAGTLEKLPDGVKSEPPPKPAPPEEQQQQGQGQQYGQQGRPQQGQQQPPPQSQMTVQQAPVQFGAVSIKVQPDDAVIVMDDQLWTGPGGDQRLNVQLAAGRHHIEVRKDGFVTYAEDVLIRPGATLTLNVNLSKK